jgi:hypothetical protein
LGSCFVLSPDIHKIDTLINQILTIIIPSENNVFDLQRTIQNISEQIRIKGTNILIADFSSKDGSLQYAVQSSSEYYRTLRISPLDLKEKDKNTINFHITTPYCLFVSPGTIFDDRSFILNQINNYTSKKKSSLYARNKDLSVIKKIFPFYYLDKNQIDLYSILCKSSDQKNVMYSKIDGSIKLRFTESKISSERFQIIRT